ncbi:YihY/virulence factor BrkB family protein [Nocardioides sp. SYSU D00065]|uniref:YihY/virulence factor BrkB family protein n=1 Tax=Nocardioides sp. SYSU D00065 TaxID=2817378 RepID=UPI001B31C3B6|nr:YhjD/YihY/BrkB family envelope integrity protein [Nocardioides sp. SYSU D00065]
MSLVTAAKQRVARLRARRPVVDHVVRMVEHYNLVKGNALAAAVTYFAFLSFFPILALSFAVFGQVAKVYSDAQDTLVDAANSVLPGLVGGDSGVSLETLQAAAPGIFSVGILLTLYSGLGWLSGMREALVAVFEEPPREQPSFVTGKLRDILALMTLGSVLVVSVAVSGVATKLLTPILEALSLGMVAGVVLATLAVVLGLAANALLFFAFFRLLAAPEVPTRSLWSGALLGAVAFEVLKQLSTLLLKSTANSAAFQAFGIALILLVWINYFSRVVVYSAAWAYTSPQARAERDARRVADQMPEGPRIDLAAAAGVVRPQVTGASSPRTAFAAGAASMLGLVALLRRRR